MNKKIVIVILNDAVSVVGGAITAFYSIVDVLSKKNTVTALYYGKSVPDKKETLSNGVELINLYKSENRDVKNVFQSIISSANPDVIIFFYPRDVKKLMNKGDFCGIKKILLNRSRPDFYSDYEKIKGIIEDFDAVQVLFDSYKRLCTPYFGGYIATIENSIVNRKSKVDLCKEKKNIIYLSRIDMWKGADLLIEAFRSVVLKHPDWKVKIYGKIEPKRYEKALRTEVARCNLQDNILFMGVTRDIETAFLDSDFCVFPSYFEGFPNGLAEAQSYGLPAIGLKGCSGVNELIIDDYNGLLVDDNPADLADAMLTMIEDKERRIKMGQHTLLTNSKYTPEMVEDKWNNLISHIAADNNIDKILKEVNENVYIFPLEKIQEMKFEANVMPFWKRVFSINFTQKSFIIYILGLKIRGALWKK